MYYRIYLISLMLLVPFFGFSQSSNWNSAIDLEVSVNSSDRIDLYADADGIHVIVQYSNKLNYCSFESDGTFIRESTRDNNVSEDPRLSRILGREGKLYIIYKEGNKIKTQRSTNAGASWSTTAVDEITLNNSTSNGLDAWTDANGVHLVYSEYDNSNGVYKTWYKRNNGINSSWVEQKDVTDETNVSGGFPSVTTSANRVHVSFTDGTDTQPSTNQGVETKSRDRYNGSWQSSQDLATRSSTDYFELNALIATGSKLHGFYYQGSSFSQSLYYKSRNLSGSWSSDSTLLNGGVNVNHKIDMGVTTNDKLHISYLDITADAQYREWNNGTWTGEFEFASDARNPQIAANSNDVYVLWIDDTNETLKLRQRDYAPLAPAGLEASVVNAQSNPRIDWDANGEADLQHYQVWKKKGTGSWGLHTTTTNTYYVDLSETNVDLNPYVNNVEIKYYIKAVDLEDNVSSASDEVVFNQEGEGMSKTAAADVEQMPQVYSLAQNYPNPFNPATTISFAVPEKALVQLQVFDLNGKMVTELLNREVAAGQHEVLFDASHLPSGVYLYRLTTPSFSEVHKMMLIK